MYLLWFPCSRGRQKLVKRSKPWHQRLLYFLVGTAGTLVIRLYFLTIRQVNGPRCSEVFAVNPSPPGVYPFWHSQQLLCMMQFQYTHSVVMISRSKDGEYIARIAAAMGFRPIRGSSSRAGASALKEMVRLCQSGQSIGITPDGPRGPRYSISPGALLLAQQGGYPIIPTAIGCSAFWELSSWDRFRIPKPFSVTYGCWGKPIDVPPDADAETRKRLADELREAMLALEQHADATARMLKNAKTQVDLPERK
jgi:lysophospholipid acyltransferase (LPLAT)-like uncharacterized protein